MTGKDVFIIIVAITLFSCGNSKQQPVEEMSTKGNNSVKVDSFVTVVDREDTSGKKQDEVEKNNPVSGTTKKEQLTNIIDTPVIKKYETQVENDPQHHHPPPLPIPPSFKFGEEKMLQLIKKNLKYPEEARKKKIEGVVFVMFKVSAEGLAKDFKVTRGLGYGCDEEALRVVKLLKEWNPAKRGNKAIEMEFGVPVEFKMD